MSWLGNRLFRARHYIAAGILTAVIPVALAFAIHRLAPWACDASAWLCLFPLSMLYSAPFAALCLPLLVFVNRRRRNPFPDGWISVVSFTGVVVQVIITGTSLWITRPYIRHHFIFDVLIFPQGFAAGAVIGAVFWVSLAVFESKSNSH